MDSDEYEGRILTIEDAHEGTNRFANKQKQTIFQNKKGDMIMVTSEKYEFGHLNDKRYILCAGISCITYGHKDLVPTESFKNEIKLTPQSLTKNHKNNLLRFEQGIIQGNKRLRIINFVFLQRLIFHKKGTLKRSQLQTELNTRDFFLKGSWRKI